MSQQKSQEQLNAEYRPNLRPMRAFCRSMVTRTGRGAPENTVWIEVIIRIDTAWQREGTLEEVVREALQEHLRFTQNLVEEGARSSRSPVPSLFTARREFSAYQQLWQRLEAREWDPGPPISPVCYAIVIDEEDPRDFDQFFAALDNSDVFDLRERRDMSDRWSRKKLLALPLRVRYRRVNLCTETGKRTLREALTARGPGNVVVLYAARQEEVSSILHRDFSDSELFIM